MRKDAGRMRRSCCDDSSVAAVWIYHCVMIRAVTVCQVHAALPVAWRDIGICRRSARQWRVDKIRLPRVLLHSDVWKTFMCNEDRRQPINLKKVRIYGFTAEMLFVSSVLSVPFVGLGAFQIECLVAGLHSESTFLEHPFAVGTHKGKVAAFQIERDLSLIHI